MPRRVLEGIVVSDKMDKTITVLVERRYMHPIYKKYLKRTKKYAAHDEANMAREGQKVQIVECAPISKRKSWTLVTEGFVAQEPVEKPAKAAAAPKAAAKKTAAAKKAPAKKAKA
ncbi:MAG: 30S ribosomal protein S17 [Micavibrio aeruginosavorus]|uniref:Small ribosomal subunit protein uS17 n=1 Tax=Micavibrio aeruginosavorus TaxID=349221 RepID=A0A2W5BEP3_9BACT|nr:MAG: 30S ribosomal protein S17 [Micavibrio aeruginosavorus]